MLTEEPTIFRSALLATKEPWRLVLLDLADDPAALLGWVGSAWVSLRGSPPAPTIDGDVTGHATHGDLCVNALLVPNWLAVVIGGPLSSSFEVPPKRLFAALGQPGTEQAGCLHSLGVKRYAVSYDKELDVITDWRTYIDGTEAHWACLSALHSIG